MNIFDLLLSPRGRLGAQPFVSAALVVYLLGVASQFLTSFDVLRRAGLWLFVAAQLVLIWIWFCLHAKRLHDAGRSSGLALGVALLYLLSVVLLLIVADGFVASAGQPLGDANASAALWLILVLYILSALGGSTQYDLAWVVVAILSFMAIVPTVLALVLTAWAARLKPNPQTSVPRPDRT
jgi:uncharacterized membrane protein YhaH (DUF805 family)